MPLLSSWRRSGGAALACACAMTLGCSALTVVRAPRPAPRAGETVRCTHSRRAPWIDTAVSASAAVGTIAMTTVDCAESGCDLKGEVVLSLGIMTVVYGVSALWGHAAVRECHDLLDGRAEGGLPSN